MRGKSGNKVPSPVGVVQSPRADCAQRPKEREPSHDGEREADDLSVHRKRGAETGATTNKEHLLCARGR